MRNAFFWALFPFLLPQAILVRRTAPRFADAAGPDRGTSGRGDTVRLLAIGDSIVAGVGASSLERALVGRTADALARTLDARVEWHAIGQTGIRSAAIATDLLPRLARDRVDFFVVSIGVNDVTGLASLRRFRRNVEMLLDALHTHSPAATVAFAGIPPFAVFPLLPQPLRGLLGFRGRTFDRSLKRMADRHTAVVHVPVRIDPAPGQFVDDGFHPSESGYAEYGAALAAALVANRPGMTAD